MKNFTIEIDGDGIALITWDMPGRSMNVISTSALEEITEWVKRVASDESIKGAVITSGKDAFCAGADLNEMELTPGTIADDGLSDEQRLEAAFDRVFTMNRVVRELETCGKPMVAAINGTAVGGGLEIALGCHYRVVSDNPQTQLGQPECKVGLMPGGGGTQRLPRLIGVANAGPLLLEGKSMRPAAAAKMGDCVIKNAV